MKRQEHIRELFTKHLSGTYNRKELEQLLEYFQLEEDKDVLSDLIAREMEILHQAEDDAVVAQIGHNLEKSVFGITRPVSRVQRLLPWFSAAAAVLLVSFAILYFYKGHTTKNETVAKNSTEVSPGTQKAILTLSDGKKVILNDSSSQITAQPGVIVSKSQGGQLIYTGSNNHLTSRISYNSVETPRGGEYQVVLPDGSHVWLNAASSITFPTAFIGPERTVKITGEAYFEITHDRNHPFKVVANDQVVEVLGTHFNVKAYHDEEGTTTTLLEGSVKVTKGKQSKTIKPGQETFVKDNIVVQQAETEAAVAWKNGQTYFKDVDIPTMMRSLSRWYNIEVVYEGKVSAELFTGGVSRKSNLSSLLKILAANNIHSRLDGRRLIITP